MQAAYLDRADAIPGKRRAFSLLLALPLVLLLWALLAFVLSVVLGQQPCIHVDC